MSKGPEKDQKEIADLEEEKKYKKGMKEQDDEEEEEDDDEEEKKMMKEKKQKMKEEIDSEINSIFSGEELSEEFKNNAKAIFEAAVLAKVDEKAKALEEEYAQKLEEEIASVNENVVSKVDEYLEYVVAEWMEENKLAVESGIRAEIVENFMSGLKTLFKEHYIDIPEEKVNMLEELVAKVESLEGELDKAITENTSLSSEINKYKKSAILDEISEGLTEVQSEKLKSLSENIEFISEEDYKEKVSLTKKKYFENVKEEKVTAKADQFATTEESIEESFSPVMAHYVKSISRTLKK